VFLLTQPGKNLQCEEGIKKRARKKRKKKKKYM